MSNDKFSWEHAIVTSDLPSTTRLLLLALSVRMNKQGDGCFPSYEQIKAMTGIRTNTTVAEHLTIAENAGFLKRETMGFRGQKWRRQSYVACFPDDGAAGHLLIDPQDEGGPVTEPPCEEEVVQSVDKGGPLTGLKVVHSLDHYKNTPVTKPRPEHLERERASADGQGKWETPDVDLHPLADDRRALKALKRVWKDSPTFADDSPADTERAFLANSPRDRERGLALWPVHIAHLRQAMGRTRFRRSSAYWAEQMWKQLPDEVVKAAEAGPA